MRRGIRPLTPVVAALATMAFATVASAAESKADEASKSADEASPTAVTIESTEVAGTQVEGDASVSTETGFSGNADISGDSLRGTFGIGAIRTLSGLNGVNVRYFVLDRLSVGVNVGVGTFTYSENDPDSTDPCPGPDCELENTRTVAALGLGLEALYFVQLGNPAGQLPFRADFGVGGRFSYFQIVNDTDIPDNLDDPTEFDIEVPAVVQLRFGDHFVLSPEFGVNFRIVPGSRAEGDANPGNPNALSSGPGFGFQITNGVGLFGGASMHYYF